jgi:prepilin-type N-terminal cleavage/methylation domain-containing protein
MNLRRRTQPLPESRPARRTDDGFTLLESLVSIVMIAVVAAGLTLFYVKANVVTALNSQAQVANQIASTAMEQVSLLPGDALLSGRPICLMTAHWAQTSPPVPPTVSKFFAAMSPVGDETLASVVCPLGSALQALLTSPAQLQTEALPTQQAVSATVNRLSLSFSKSFFIGLCWQNRGAAAGCVKPSLTPIPGTMVAMLRVVIAVTWTSTRCPVNTDQVKRCSYVTDTLVNQEILDPTFR